MILFQKTQDKIVAIATKYKRILKALMHDFVLQTTEDKVFFIYFAAWFLSFAAEERERCRCVSDSEQTVHPRVCLE